MRRALPIFGVLLLTVGFVAAFAWARAGRDRYESLEREGLGIARVVQGAVAESEALLSTAERYLAERLESVARRLDHALDRTRGPAVDLLQEVAEEEHVGRIFLWDADLAPIARARTPRPVDAGPVALLTADDKVRLEWDEARHAVEALAPEAGHGIPEGMRENVYGTRRRFGVAYGRRSGGVLLLRANADELARLEQRFGLGPRLERIAALPRVRDVRIVAGSGETLLAAGAARPGDAAPPSPPLAGTEAVTVLESDALRVLMPLTSGVLEFVDVRLDRSSADRAVERSRRAILLGGLAALVVAASALVVVYGVERRHRIEQARAAARLDEERRFAEMGALAALVTHEVANPLNAMRLALQLLSEEEDPEERARLLVSMREGIDRIAGGVEGFLRSTAAHAPTPRAIGPSLLERVQRRVEDTARQKGVRVVVDTRGSRDVWADPLVIEEALVNVVRNAVQATPAGTRVELVWTDGEADTVRVAVSDEGPGFPPDAPALLRLGAPKGGDGHGLGLPLARRFLEAEGGRIVLGEAEKGGARVEVFLPTVRPGGRDP